MCSWEVNLIQRSAKVVGIHIEVASPKMPSALPSVLSAQVSYQLMKWKDDIFWTDTQKRTPSYA